MKSKKKIKNKIKFQQDFPLVCPLPLLIYYPMVSNVIIRSTTHQLRTDVEGPASQIAKQEKSTVRSV